MNIQVWVCLLLKYNYVSVLPVEDSNIGTSRGGRLSGE